MELLELQLHRKNAMGLLSEVCSFCVWLGSVKDLKLPPTDKQLKPTVGSSNLSSGLRLSLCVRA